MSNAESTYNETEQAELVADLIGGSAKDHQKVLDAYQVIWKQEMAKGFGIKMRGFGSFYIKAVAARVGRNPRTGEEIQISARNAVKFTPSKALKDLLKG